VGLKGTDNIVDKARKLGANPVAPHRALAFLKALLKYQPDAQGQNWITCPHPMGAKEVKAAGLKAEVLPLQLDSTTTAADTQEAIRGFLERKVELIVFVGGDGTARDIFDALPEPEAILVLGVPAGVKMYSGIFAFSPEAAAAVVSDWLKEDTQVESFEVMDADETAIRQDEFAVKLYGYLQGPLVPARMQGGKLISPSTIDERENQEAVARTIVEDMVEGDAYIFGPGSTVRKIANLLHVEKTLLGVDLFLNRKMHLDVNEQQLLDLVPDFLNTWIIVSPIGNQGMLFGRGNQQISPAIIRRIPPEQILVVATHSKVNSLAERGLHVDTGDSEVNAMLSGYIRVLVDYRTWRMMKVTSND
jgi:predicted polyphosphate/ATP-dependent NAD kinase